MIKNQLLISIVLPVYNGKKFLSEAIESCLSQTYKNFELIIVNDCSTDNSLAIANSFAQIDNRIKVFSNKENKKLPETLNIGHRNTLGDYITWTSDDNILKPNFLEVLLKNIEHTKADIVYSNYDMVNNDGSFRREHSAGPTEHLLFGNKIGASFLYKKEVFEDLDGYDSSLFLLEDYDFWLRASLKFKILHINTNLYKYRIHNKSLTHDIQFNILTNEFHKKRVKLVFNKVSNELNWNKKTKKILVSNFIGDVIEFNTYFQNKQVINSDLKKYASINIKSNKVMNGLIKCLRNHLMLNKNNFRLKILFKVLLLEPLILFDNSFSKKVTLNYFIKSFKP